MIESSDTGIFLAKKEDFGIAPIEYMAAGLPVLGVDEPNTNNHIKNGVSGFVVPPQEEAIVDKIQEMMSRDWNREEIANAAEEFNAKRFREEIQEIIEGI